MVAGAAEVPWDRALWVGGGGRGAVASTDQAVPVEMCRWVGTVISADKGRAYRREEEEEEEGR